VLGYVLDLSGAVEHVEKTVTLPSSPCEDCTLQVTQFSYGLPLDQSTYYHARTLFWPVRPSNRALTLDRGSGRPGLRGRGPSLSTPRGCTRRLRAIASSASRDVLRSAPRRWRCSGSSASRAAVLAAGGRPSTPRRPQLANCSGAVVPRRRSGSGPDPRGFQPASRPRPLDHSSGTRSRDATRGLRIGLCAQREREHYAGAAHRDGHES
jgi:hypothetical protein